MIISNNPLPSRQPDAAKKPRGRKGLWATVLCVGMFMWVLGYGAELHPAVYHTGVVMFFVGFFGFVFARFKE